MTALLAILVWSGYVTVAGAVARRWLWRVHYRGLSEFSVARRARATEISHAFEYLAAACWVGGMAMIGWFTR